MTAATVPSSQRQPVDPFTILGLAGIMYAIIGGADLASQLFPMALGSSEWEFGTYSSVMDSLPLLTMGLGFLGIFAVVRSHTWLARIIGIVFLLLALFVLAGAFLYATNVPQALRMGRRSPLQTGIKKAVTKASLQSVFYPIAYLWLAVFLLKNRGRSG